MSVQPANLNRIYDQTCIVCGVAFKNRFAKAKYCPDCREVKRREYKRLSYERRRTETKRTFPWHFTGSGGACDRCKFVDDCMALKWQLWFTPYCAPEDHDTGEPNKLHRLWEGEK